MTLFIFHSEFDHACHYIDISLHIYLLSLTMFRRPRNKSLRTAIVSSNILKEKRKDTVSMNWYRSRQISNTINILSKYRTDRFTYRLGLQIAYRTDSSILRGMYEIITLKSSASFTQVLRHGSAVGDGNHQHLCVYSILSQLYAKYIGWRDF